MAEPDLTPAVATTTLRIDADLAALAASGNLPIAWVTIITELLTRLRTALVADTIESAQAAQEDLACRLLVAGRNACWTEARTASDLRVGHAWQVAASLHQDLRNALTLGWPRRQTWRNPALPIEVNHLPDDPVAPYLTDLGEQYLAILLQDPLGITATQARAALATLPATINLDA